MAVHHWKTLAAPDIPALMAKNPVAILPMGAFEQHGPHLPFATDSLLAESLVDYALEQLSGPISVIRLPLLPLGDSIEHHAFAGTLSLEPNTLQAVAYECGASFAAAGGRRLVFFSGHGGNKAGLDIAATRLRRDFGLQVASVCYFDWPIPESLLPAAVRQYDLHGGAIETALMRYFMPDLVRDAAVSDWQPNATAALLNGQLAWMAEDLCAAGVAGNATLGTSELGEQLAARYAMALNQLIIEMADLQ
ncbi:creatininase family protein [Spiribacter sp. C176]|uniref:Creatininase family protein n=1 Tax=Spiribacter salilacus TaxID=2664894 RepID=A0A6N7QS61_9GAMM|nr:creatininase family protein [Spiribacter salilacus]MRH78832.1 creatininase family protein [Spiribacter salilacus]